MQIILFRFTKIFPLLILSFFLLLSCVTNGQAKTVWNKISVDEYEISINLTSGYRIEGIRYKKRNLTNDWILVFSRDQGTNIFLDQKNVESIPEKEFEVALQLILEEIKKNYDNKLAKIHLNFNTVTEFWAYIRSYLNRADIPMTYELKGKDANLAKKISKGLSNYESIQNFCTQIRKLNKQCEKNIISQNPVTFDAKYIGKSWKNVVDLSDLGMPTNSLWMAINLQNKEE